MPSIAERKAAEIQDASPAPTQEELAFWSNKPTPTIQTLKSHIYDQHEEILELKSHYELFGQLGVPAIARAAKDGRRPVIWITRGGGLGDNVQACCLAKAWKIIYPKSYLILMVKFDNGLSMMSAMSDEGAPFDACLQATFNLNHRRVRVGFMHTVDIYCDMVYALRTYYGQEHVAALHSGRMGTGQAKNKRRAFREIERIVREQSLWDGDEWMDHLYNDYTLSNSDWIRMHVNLLKWQNHLTGLPYIDRIPLEPPDMTGPLRYNKLEPGRYVTFMAGAGGQAVRKEYPWTETPVGEGEMGGWELCLPYVVQKGYKILQLGHQGETEIPGGLGVSLVGQTPTIAEVTGYIKHAAFHIGIEGGPVHFARCVGTPCIVVHGPTGKTQFGYDDNINLGHDRCFACFWKTGRWYKEPCPERHKSCYNFPAAGEIIEAIDTMVDKIRDKEKRPCQTA